MSNFVKIAGLLLVVIFAMAVMASADNQLQREANNRNPSPVQAAESTAVRVDQAPQTIDTSMNQVTESMTGGPSIHFPEPSYDFGVIEEGVKVSHTFIVQNTGDLPLKLIRAKAS